ncbi:MAG: DapH/DapD/GlmU-related protein [Mucilaginibacter sp.]
MHINSLFKFFKSATIHKLISTAYLKVRILKYKSLSSCNNVHGKPNYIGPALIRGEGKVIFDSNVNIGVVQSPGFYSTYCYIDSRSSVSVISIGENVYINNNACLISEGEGIFIGSNVLIGPNFNAFDSDFHELHPQNRLSKPQKTAKVEIGQNVFIGANVTILKGVAIGKNSVIASNSVVSKSIPGDVIAGGNPCKVIKDIII